MVIMAIMALYSPFLEKYSFVWMFHFNPITKLQFLKINLKQLPLAFILMGDMPVDSKENKGLEKKDGDNNK